MIGYSLLNSKIQEFCLSGIINSFLNRSVIYLYCLYLNYELEDESEKDKIINLLYNVFIQEELRLYPRLFKNFTDFKEWETLTKPKSTSLYYVDDATNIIIEVSYDKNGGYINKPLESKNYNDYPDLILKYILSSNLVFNKDYEFNKKSPEDVINDGKNNLKKLFKKNFEEFYNSIYFNSKNSNIEEKIDYEAYFQSIDNQVTRIWNSAYDLVDKNENPFSNWWKMGGEKFTDEIRDITNYLNNLSKQSNINEKTEKQIFIDKLNQVINTLKYARNSTIKSDFAYVALSYILFIPKDKGAKEFVPLDSKGNLISLKGLSSFLDKDKDLNLRSILDYFISILTFYYAKLTNQITIESSIRANIKKYISNARLYGAYPPDTKNKIVYEDDEKTTLNNLSNYFIKNNGYINSLYTIKNANGSEKEGILQFYKNRKLLEDREYYLGLLTSQINSLQTTKVDQEELSKEG